jgi:histidyl-tRNA synthetase
MNQTNKTKARLPRGLIDREAMDMAATARMLSALQKVYERYGFEPLETPIIEYTDALGKFLPDQDRPNEGVFSFQDDDEQWLSLRYDLTAPLARFVAEHFDALPKPYRSYRAGYVFRNEKPGPGRFRQFMQCDADIVGAHSVAADAEMCMMMADAMEALGISRGSYVIKVNNRKILDGMMEALGLEPARRLTVLRAIDKLDRLGIDGVEALLAEGRNDDSGDFTKGAQLTPEQIKAVLSVLSLKDGYELFEDVENGFRGSENFLINAHFQAGLQEVKDIIILCRASGYGIEQIVPDVSVVRGLEYYTGPVFEAELLIPVEDDKGQSMRFGSVGGGGRYDGLIGRFRSEPVPATGFSIGVSRLFAALKAINSQLVNGDNALPLVVITVMDRARMADYQAFAARLRLLTNEDGEPLLRAEIYLGEAGFKAQMKYADRRGAFCALIQGSDEAEKGEIQIKDLKLGAQLAASGKDRADYLEQQAKAQFSTPLAKLEQAVLDVLRRHAIS